MKQLSTTGLARISNTNRGIQRVAPIQTVRRLSKLSSTMEPLESRTMMSAATITTPPVLLAAAKATAVKNTVVAAPTVSKTPAKTSIKKTSAGPVKTVSVPPAAPTAVSAAGLSRTQIKLTWTDSTTNVSGYYVYRSSDGVNFAKVETLSGATKTTFSDAGLAGGQTYKYEVAAFNNATTSAMSGVAIASTMLAAPSGLAVAATSSTQTRLTWVDNDSSATGYIVLRSTDGVHFTQLSKLTTAAANSAVDNTASPFTKYYYEIQATDSSATSPASNVASVTTPLAVPTGVLAAAISPTSVMLTWTDTDAAAKGYAVLRSTNGESFSQIEQINSASTKTWTDNSVTSNQQYAYEVKAINGGSSSAASVSAAVTTPLPAPTNLIANGSGGTSVILKWTAGSSSAKGYLISRSTDGVHFTTLATLTSGSATTYTDATVSSGKKYSYEIQATAGTNSSAVSNIAAVTIAAAPIAPTPSPAPSTTTVSITTRYTGELVITATGTADKVSVTQSGSTLTIVANGQTTTQPVPTAGLFIYARGGTDGITVDQSVTVPTTVEAIDGAIDHITSGSTDVTVWDDSTDIFTGAGSVHSVSTFAGNVSKAAGASLKDPTDSGSIMKVSASLWGTGPVAGDVNQGDSGDCYFLSSLAAFATVEPGMLEQSAVDMGDGTYTVQYMNSNQPEFVRVSNDLPTNGSESYVYARPGSTGSIWAAIMEKAYAYFRTGANTYASISSGWMGDVYSALGVNSGFFYLGGMSQTALYTRLSADLANGKAVTLGTFNSAPDLVSGHAYTLVSCSINANGVTSYVVRNPWGISGNKLENSQGYATLTFAQMLANFQDCCEATS